MTTSLCIRSAYSTVAPLAMPRNRRCSCSNSLFSKLNAAYGERRTPSLASTIAAFISPVNAALGRSSSQRIRRTAVSRAVGRPVLRAQARIDDSPRGPAAHCPFRFGQQSTLKPLVDGRTANTEQRRDLDGAHGRILLVSGLSGPSRDPWQVHPRHAAGRTAAHLPKPSHGCPVFTPGRTQRRRRRHRRNPSRQQRQSLHPAAR